MAESKTDKIDNKIEKQTKKQQEKKQQIQQGEGTNKQSTSNKQQNNQIPQSQQINKKQNTLQDDNKQDQVQHSTDKQQENKYQSNINQQTQQKVEPSSRQFQKQQNIETNLKQGKLQQPKLQTNQQKKSQQKQNKQQVQEKQSQPNQFFQQAKESNTNPLQTQQNKNNQITSVNQQTKVQQKPKQPGIIPYNKVSLQFNDFSKYDKSNKGVLTIQQFIELSKDQKYEITQNRAKQLFQKYSSNQTISYQNANQYIKSMKQFQQIVDLKLNVWKKFNDFRNGCQKFETINDQSISHHHIILSLKTNKDIQTQFRFKALFGNQNKYSDKFNLQLGFQTRNQNYQQIFRDNIEKQSQTIQQLFKHFNISFLKENNRTQIVITNKDDVLINDIINQLEEYVKSFGENFHVDIGLQLSAVNNISQLLTDIPLISWLSKGFALDFQIQGNKQWVKSFRKYLASIVKNHDKKTAAYIYLLNNSNFNIQFKAPSQSSEFFQKLGINQIINKSSPLKNIFNSSSEQSKLNEVIKQLKSLLLPLSSCEQISLKLSLPFLNFTVESKGNNVKELISLLI